MSVELIFYQCIQLKHGPADAQLLLHRDLRSNEINLYLTVYWTGNLYAGTIDRNMFIGNFGDTGVAEQRPLLLFLHTVDSSLLHAV